MKTVNYIGTTVGRLTVVTKTDQKSKSGNVYYRCLCECGKEVLVHSGNIKTGSVNSCGCLRSDTCTRLRKIHGLSKTRIDRIIKHMVARCHDPKHISYKDYGAKGITVCEEWKNNRASFFEWAMSNGYRDDLTIERLNPFLGYFPDNCTFIPRSEQNKNKRCHHDPPRLSESNS